MNHILQGKTEPKERHTATSSNRWRGVSTRKQAHSVPCTPSVRTMSTMAPAEKYIRYWLPSNIRADV